MASARPFEEYFRPAGHARAAVPWWRSWEAWLTLGLILLLQVPVVGSLESANWVREMPSLVAAALLGLTAGWLLAHAPLRGWVATPLGLLACAASTLGLVLGTLVIADPATPDTWQARWSEFAARMTDWWAALLAREVSSDALPFVVLLVAAVFVVSYLTVWAVVRWRNAWAAVLPGGFALLTNISFLPGQPSFSVVVYVMAAGLLITRMQYLRAFARWNDDDVETPDFMSVEVLFISAVVAAVLVLVAWTVPTANNWGPVARAWGVVIQPVASRLEGAGGVFIGVSSKKALPVHQFGSSLALQGPVTLAREPMLEIEAPRASANLRGAVYDEYTGTGWKLSQAAVRPLNATIQSVQDGTDTTRAEIRQPVVATVTVVGAGATAERLLSIGEPLTADQPGRLLAGPALASAGIIPDRAVPQGATYRTAGTISAASVQTLQEAGARYPVELFQRYTQLPASLPPEVGALSRQVVADAATPYEAARHVEAFLRENYAYTLSPPSVRPRRDATAFFLLDERAGYFDHFASAMAVMLRTVGIPTRVAVGFALDEVDYRDADKKYVITEERAWAWPEVYFPGLGWVEFNPSPVRQLVDRPGQNTVSPAETATDENVPLPEEDALFGAVAEEDIALNAGDVESTATARAARVVASVLLVSVLSLIAVFAGRWGWERSFGALPAPSRRWAKVMRFASLAGVTPDASLTPLEVAADLAPLAGDETALHALARDYVRTRYGRSHGAATESADEARAMEQHYQRVRRALLRLIGRRVLRLGQSPDRLTSRRRAAAAARAREATQFVRQAR